MRSGKGLRSPIGLVEVDDVVSGIEGRERLFRGLLHQSIEILGRPGNHDRIGAGDVQSDGDIAVRIVADVAGQQGLVAEPAMKETSQFADRDAGLRDVELQGVGLIGADVIGVGERSAVRRRSDRRHSAHQVLRERLSAGAAGRHVSRNREGLDDKAAILMRLPGHDSQADHHEQAKRDGQKLQADA